MPLLFWFDYFLISRPDICQNKAPKNILKSTDLYSLRQFLSQRKSEGIEIRKFHKIPFLATQQWLWRRPLQPLWIAQWTILNFKWPHSLSSSLSKWLLYRYSLHQMNIFLMARLQCLRPGQYFFITKGQEISEGNWCLQFSQKTTKILFHISALTSKKWLNQTNKGPLLCWM